MNYNVLITNATYSFYILPIVHQTRRLTGLGISLIIWRINIFDGIVRTGQHTFLTAFAIFLPFNTNMPVRTHLKFSQHVIRTSIQTIPTSFTKMCSDPYIFGLRMPLKRIMKFHLSFLLTILDKDAEAKKNCLCILNELILLSFRIRACHAIGHASL